MVTRDRLRSATTIFKIHLQRLSFHSVPKVSSVKQTVGLKGLSLLRVRTVPEVIYGFTYTVQRWILFVSYRTNPAAQHVPLALSFLIFKQCSSWSVVSVVLFRYFTFPRKTNLAQCSHPTNNQAFFSAVNLPAPNTHLQHYPEPDSSCLMRNAYHCFPLNITCI